MPRKLKETGKQRSGRIPLDYFKQADRLRRLRDGLTLLACIASVGWLILAGLRLNPLSVSESRLALMANHGPLSKPHARIEQDCEKCHDPFIPIDGTGWTTRFLGQSHASDQNCQKCHRDIQSHFAKEAEPPACASCHQDHRGKDISLLAIADSHCTNCHATHEQNALTRSADSQVKSLKNVNRFDTDRRSHPEFALHRDGEPADPGHVKFNHALHMTPGLPKTPGTLPLKAIRDLPKDAQLKYQADPTAIPDLSELVQLRCDSCHGSNPGSGKSKGAVGSSGVASDDLMEPVRYDMHCAACHPNDYCPKLPAIRHGLTPSDLREELRKVYSAQYLAGHPDLKTTLPNERPIPGRADSSKIKSAQKDVNRQVERAERWLLSGQRCGECHAFESIEGKPIDKIPGQFDPDAIRIIASNIPTRWYKEAKFSHSAHRDSKCQVCHERASIESSDPSRVSSDVLIPESDNCRSCHAPLVETNVVGQTLSARNDCIECHGYHGHSQAIKASTSQTIPSRQVDLEILRFVRERSGLEIARQP